MTLTITANPLPLRLDNGDTYRIGNTRACMDTVVYAYNSGSSAEQICRDYPGLELADVHSVIAFYLHHKYDVDAYIAAREADAAKLRAEVEAQPQNQELREKLIARKNQRS